MGRAWLVPLLSSLSSHLLKERDNVDKEGLGIEGRRGGIVCHGGRSVCLLSVSLLLPLRRRRKEKENERSLACPFPPPYLPSSEREAI